METKYPHEWLIERIRYWFPLIGIVAGAAVVDCASVIPNPIERLSLGGTGAVIFLYGLYLVFKQD